MVVETFQGGQLWMFDHRPDKYKTKKVTPLGLFLQAHLEGLYLRDAPGFSTVRKSSSDSLRE
jgi:hypothetical protein